MTFSYQDYKRKISKSVFDQIYQYRQTGCLSSESGGVLIGRQIISTGNLIIDHCTVPMPLDVCKRTRYLRKDPKHIEFFTTLRQRENNIYAYVGEWHTHPELIPSYSSMDLCNWKMIGKITHANADTKEQKRYKEARYYQFLELFGFSKPRMA